MLKLGLIVGSTRRNRFADIPARWIAEGAAAHEDIALTILDLREQNLPLFDEPHPPSHAQGTLSRPEAEAWRNKLSHLDAFVVTVAEYNHGPTAALKNAFDYAYHEWRRKPVAFVGYGGAGGVRAMQQLRTIVIALEMAPLKHGVTIASDLYVAARNGRSLNDYAHLVQARDDLFGELIWWGMALKRARE